MLKIGAPLPQFGKLPGVDGKSYSASDFNQAKVMVIVFSCNHCPYVRAYEERMIAFQRDYSPHGVELVAINSNDVRNYPDDSFEKMVARAKEKNFNFKYLRDEDQKVAEAFGATHTPEFFVFDEKRTLRYSGKMDDSWENPSAVKENYLRNATDALLNGKKVEKPETFSIGCTIKWKTS